jgi:hypothetical protein
MQILTTPMETVASANGSPMMRPTLKVARPPPLYPDSILRREGDPREPYEGIEGEARGVVLKVGGRAEAATAVQDRGKGVWCRF